jgi:hypothetical protein
VQDEAGEDEHGGRARHLVRQERCTDHEGAEIAEECGGERGAHPGADGGVALAFEHDGAERDEAQREHQREQHERCGDAVRDLARGFGRIQWWRNVARGVI